jgi:hypothetical protein
LTGCGGAVYLDNGRFEAECCCAVHCDADRGAAFYLYQLQTKTEPAKIVYSTFIECSYLGAGCNTGAIAGDKFLLSVEQLNFSNCCTSAEGSAFSIEKQGSVLRFISVEKTQENPISAVDFDHPSDDRTFITIEWSRFLSNTVQW